MSERLPDWPRPHFRHPGCKPFLLFVVYGKFGNVPELSESRYRSSGPPSGFKVPRYDAQQYPDFVTQFQKGYVWNEFRSRHPVLASRIAESSEYLILRGEIEDSDNLNYLRDSVGLITFLLDHGGIAVHDPQVLQWWEPEDWRNRIFDPAGPVPGQHVVILTSEESDPVLTWFHTRGLRKFGRRDLSVHHVPSECHDGIVDMFERFIQLQAFGGIIEEANEIRMKSLPEGMTCHHRGNLDDPDFNNVHVEITWRHN